MVDVVNVMIGVDEDELTARRGILAGAEYVVSRGVIMRFVVLLTVQAVASFMYRVMYAEGFVGEKLTIVGFTDKAMPTAEDRVTVMFTWLMGYKFTGKLTLIVY